MAEATISCAVQLTARDIFLANLWFLSRRRWLFAIPLTLAALGLALILIARGDERQRIVQNFLPLFELLLVWLAFLVGGQYFAAQSLIKQQKALQQTTRYVFSDDGIALESETASSRMDWSHVYQVAESKRYIFLHVSKSVRHIIPKITLSDEGAIVGLRRLIRAHVQGKVQLLD